MPHRSTSPTRRRRSSPRRRSGEQTLVLATELPERPLILGGCCCCARRRGRGPGRAARAGRRRLGRRARRPEHARDLAVGERMGHAAADAGRLRRGRPTRRRARRCARSRSAGAGVHPRERDPHRKARDRPRAERRGRRLRRPSTRTVSTRPRSARSCRSPAASSSPRPRRLLRGVAREATVVGRRPHGPAAGGEEPRACRPPVRGARPVATRGRGPCLRSRHHGAKPHRRVDRAQGRTPAEPTPGSGIRTPARPAGRTIATTSSTGTSASARNADTTSR